jgi:hypothetical protein
MTGSLWTNCDWSGHKPRDGGWIEFPIVKTTDKSVWVESDRGGLRPVNRGHLETHGGARVRFTWPQPAYQQQPLYAVQREFYTDAGKAAISEARQ